MRELISWLQIMDATNQWLVTAKVCSSCFFSGDCSSVHMKILINEKKWLYHPPTHSGSHLIRFFFVMNACQKVSLSCEKTFQNLIYNNNRPTLEKTWHNKNKQQILHIILSGLSLKYFIKRCLHSLSKWEQIKIFNESWFYFYLEFWTCAKI